MASQAKAWTAAGIERLRALAKPAVDCGPDELWRGQLATERTLLAQLQTQVRLIEGRLDAMAATDARTKRLRGSVRQHAQIGLQSLPGRFVRNSGAA